MAHFKQTVLKKANLKKPIRAAIGDASPKKSTRSKPREGENARNPIDQIIIRDPNATSSSMDLVPSSEMPNTSEHSLVELAGIKYQVGVRFNLD